MYYIFVKRLIETSWIPFLIAIMYYVINLSILDLKFNLDSLKRVITQDHIILPFLTSCIAVGVYGLYKFAKDSTTIVVENIDTNFSKEQIAKLLFLNYNFKIEAILDDEILISKIYHRTSHNSIITNLSKGRIRITTNKFLSATLIHYLKKNKVIT